MLGLNHRKPTLSYSGIHTNRLFVCLFVCLFMAVLRSSLMWDLSFQTRDGTWLQQEKRQVLITRSAWNSPHLGIQVQIMRACL